MASKKAGNNKSSGKTEYVKGNPQGVKIGKAIGPVKLGKPEHPNPMKKGKK